MKKRLQSATQAAGRFIVRNRVPIANGLLFLSGFVRTLEPAGRTAKLIELAAVVTQPISQPRRSKKRP